MLLCDLRDTAVSVGTNRGHSSGGEVPSVPTLVGVGSSGASMSSGSTASGVSPVFSSCLRFRRYTASPTCTLKLLGPAFAVHVPGLQVFSPGSLMRTASPTLICSKGLACLL